VISLIALNPSLFENHKSYTLLKLRYREQPTDLHHHEIEIFSDLIKPADYSSNLMGKNTKLIVGTIIAVLVLLVVCIVSIVKIRKMREGHSG
jgi:hypothetical protein